MKITDSPTFCPFPWTFLRLGTNGGVGVCSYFNDVGNTQTSSMDEILNGNTVKEIRQSIINGKWHSLCNFCKKGESSGGRSQRLKNIEHVPQTTIDAINNNPESFILTQASISWNNLCNLACNYCGPRPSTKWQQMLGTPIKLLSASDNSLNWLIENSKTLYSIGIGGGEPLLQKEIGSLLSQLKNPVSAYITTNLSVELENNQIFETIKNNKNINSVWSISFDGIGDKFEYVRHGATWNQFRKNIDVLKKYNQKIEAHPAYSIYCAFDLLEYVDFCVDQELSIYWCDIFEPHQLDIRYSPKSLRDIAIQNIDAVFKKYENRSTLNLNLDLLKKYREMAIKGFHFNPAFNLLSDKQKAQNMLDFNKKIETQLPKAKLFAEVWPKVHSTLISEAQ